MIEVGFCANGHQLAADDLRFCPDCGVAVACSQGHRVTEALQAFCETCGEALAITRAAAPAGPGRVRRTRFMVGAAAAVAVILAAGLAAVFLVAGGDDGPTPSSAAPPATAGPSRPPRPTGEAPSATVTVPATGAPSSSTAAAPTPTSAVAVATTPPPTATATRTPVPPTATSAPAPPAYANLVGNGGFETGSLSAPWGTGIYEPRSEVFWGSADADAVVVSDSVHGGRYALRITNRSPQAAQIYRTLSQKVDVKGGQQYCLTWWARTANARNGVMNFRPNDAWTIVLSIGGGLPDYTQYAGTFVAEDNNIDLRIVSENTGTAWVDDIELTEGACKVPNGPILGGAAPR